VGRRAARAPLHAHASNPPQSLWGPLEIDFAPFARGVPALKRPQSIGSGALFLNRHLAATLTTSAGGAAPLVAHLVSLTLDGTPVMLNARAAGSPAALSRSLARAGAWLASLPPDTPTPHARLESMGFLPGWGATAGRSVDTMNLLADVLEAADPDRLADFLARVPSITRVALVSVHGWFAQAGVLGRPDTGGQVVYVLDKVRALERAMASRLAAAGVSMRPRVVVLTRLIPDAEGTTCDVPVERVAGTEGAVILRVPFRKADGGVLQSFVPRFSVWPYLERFAADAATALEAELGGPPALVVGNYVDGSLVAALLSARFDATQLSVAHALELTKYPQMATRWNAPEFEGMHPDVHVTADLLSMARADCIVTSTFQEIAGKSAAVTASSLEVPGQYESFSSLTLPGLYRVTHGVDVFDPRFNIVSPGVDASVYFPASESDRRLVDLQPGIHDMLFGTEQASLARGTISPDRAHLPIVFSIGRLDSVKNMHGLASWYADCARLRKVANLVIVSGEVETDRIAAADADARSCAAVMHSIFDSLGGCARWVRGQSNPTRNGELYRVIADTGGAGSIFVLPSTYEALGLVTLEAMSSGLPPFVTIHGGAAEVVKDGVSGFHIDPFHGAAAADCMASFIEASAADPSSWAAVSAAAKARIQARYTWPIYAERLLSLAKVSTFWRSLTVEASAPRRAYQAALYHLLLRPRMALVPRSAEEREEAEGEGGGGKGG
jgi:sucrose synthase